MSYKYLYVLALVVSLFTIAFFITSKKDDLEQNPEVAVGREPQRHKTLSKEAGSKGAYQGNTNKKASHQSALDEILDADAKGNLKEFVASLLSKNEEQGLEFLAGLEINTDYQAIGEAIYDHFILEGRYLDGLAAFEVLDENLTLATPLLHKFVSEYYRNDPKAALVWVSENNTLNGIENAAYNLGEHTAKTEKPELEINTMLETSIPIDIRTSYLTGAMESWVEEDFNAAFSFISNTDLPGYYYDETIYMMAGKAAAADPNVAMEWANTIIDEQYRHSALSEVSASWLKNDPEAFQVWVEEQPAKIQTELRDILKDGSKR